MENASKALLIAGSVLIVILLIAMGVRVFTSTKGTVDATEDTMKTAEDAQYYSKFTKYMGSKQSKAQVMSLLNEVIASNATSSNRTMEVYYRKKGGATDVSYTKSGSNKITSLLNIISSSSAQYFQIACSYYNNTGKIAAMVIREL